MGSKKQWDLLRHYNYYKGRITPPPRIGELESEAIKDPQERVRAAIEYYMSDNA